MLIEERTEIEAPSDEVWAVISDVERWHEWTASITSVKLIDPAGFAVGARAKIRQPGLPPVVWRITEIEPGRSFTWESASPGLKSVGIHSVEPLGPGRSRSTLRLENSGPLSFLLKMIEKKSREYVGLESKGLKSRSEQRAKVTATAR